MIYLDHAATTKPDEKVIEAVSRCMAQDWANPSSAYAAAGEGRRQLRLARRAVAGMLNAGAGEIVFTSGGSEANSQAMTLAAGGHAVVSAIEHASVLEAARRWAGSSARRTSSAPSARIRSWCRCSSPTTKPA